VWLTLFDAEDQGGIDGWEWFVGSTRMADRIANDPVANFAGLVLLDMIGDRDQRVCRASDSTPGLADGVFRMAGELGLGAWLPYGCQYYVSDDHTPFLERGLPAVDMIDFDYAYWHTLEDTCDKIGPEQLSRVGRTIEAWAEQGAPQQ
jgi:glutaminyl-peptide cyclotransferase